MSQLSISMARVYVLFSKSVGVGIARRDSHNDLVGTVGHFSIHLYITHVPPPLKKYKECPCALPSVSISKNIWCGLILKNHQNQEVTEFLSGETVPKNSRSLYLPGKSCSSPYTLA